jgi:NAD dependent epimerase/dehydratase family enzyme
VPVPRFGPRLLLGDISDEMLFDSLRVHPARAQASGYVFSFPELEPALRHVLERPARA